MVKNLKWPPGIVDGERLHEFLGLTSRDPEVIGESSYSRLLEFEIAIDRAALRGTVTRVRAKDPGTGEVVAYGYRQEELRKLVPTGATTAVSATAGS